MTFPRRAEPKIQPTRMRRCDAEDVADEVIAAAKQGRVVLHILPNREYRIVPAELALIGVYDDQSSRTEIADAIKQRCDVITEEELIYKASER